MRKVFIDCGAPLDEHEKIQSIKLFAKLKKLDLEKFIKSRNIIGLKMYLNDNDLLEEWKELIYSIAIEEIKL